MDLIQELELRKRELEIAIRSLRKTGTDRAQKEKLYKVKLKQKALELRDGGMPVTLIDKVVYGDEEVASLREERDIAEAIYEANRESINATKLFIRIIQEQISREWVHTND